MRKTRALVAVAFVLLVMPMLMGATITITAINPNPNKMANTLAANGSYTLANGESTTSFYFMAYLKGTTQTTGLAPTPDAAKKTWTVSLTVAPVTYNPCWVFLFYKDVNNMPQATNDSNKMDQVVK